MPQKEINMTIQTNKSQHILKCMVTAILIGLAVSAQANESSFSQPSTGFMTQKKAREYCASFQLSLPSKEQFIELATTRGASYNADQMIDVGNYRMPQDESLRELFWSSEPANNDGQVLVFYGQAGITQTRNPDEPRAAAICYGAAPTTTSPFADYLKKYNRENLIGLSRVSAASFGYILRLVVSDSGARLERICNETFDLSRLTGLRETAHPSDSSAIASTTTLSNALTLVPPEIRDFITQSSPNLIGTDTAITTSNGKLITKSDLVPTEETNESGTEMGISEECGRQLRNLPLRGGEIADAVFIVSEVAQADAVHFELSEGEFPSYLQGAEASGWKIAKVNGKQLSVTRSSEAIPVFLGLDFLRISYAYQPAWAIQNPPWFVKFKQPTEEERSQLRRLLQKP